MIRNLIVGVGKNAAATAKHSSRRPMFLSMGTPGERRALYDLCGKGRKAPFKWKGRSFVLSFYVFCSCPCPKALPSSWRKASYPNSDNPIFNFACQGIKKYTRSLTTNYPDNCPSLHLSNAVPISPSKMVIAGWCDPGSMPRLWTLSRSNLFNFWDREVD